MNSPNANPKNSLPRLQRMAGKEGCATVTWDRAIQPTAARLGLDAPEAREYTLKTVQQLGPDDFVESVIQRESWFDVYAVYRDGYGWYVKIGEDEDGVLVISHHEPEKGPISTAKGCVIEEVEPQGRTEESKGGKAK